MKKSRVLISVCIAGLFAAGTVSARDKWEYNEGSWDKTQSYGEVTVAQDSVQQWGPWERFVEPAAGEPSGVQYAGAGSGDLYRPLLSIPAETPRIVFEPVGGNGIVRGQLTWTTTADLDFHLTVPGGGHVAYYNLTVNIPGGGVARLDHDNLGGTIDVQPNLRVENIAVTGTPAVGNYAFYVHNYSAHGSGPTTATVRLTGDGGTTSRTYTPTLQTTGSVSPTYTVTRTATGATYSP